MPMVEWFNTGIKSLLPYLLVGDLALVWVYIPTTTFDIFAHVYGIKTYTICSN